MQRHLRNDTKVFSCNLRCLLIFLHASLPEPDRVAPGCVVGRISYNLYFDCKHVRYVTCDSNKRIYFNYDYLLIEIEVDSLQYFMLWMFLIQEKRALERKIAELEEELKVNS